eukprot:PITA_25964
MQKKDQTFKKFCEFKYLVEKESGKKIKALRSENDGECVSQEFKEFCAMEGIKRELTAPHNPQQNGVAERKNRTIVVEELLVPKEEEPQIDAKQSHAEVPGVETSTQEESSRDGRKHTREAGKLLEDGRENVGAPSSQHRQRRSPKRYTGYMALAGECVEIESSSFEETVQQLIWVDAMVEEYDSIVRNSVWDVIPRLENKSVVISRWLYKVKQAANGSVEKHKARFVARGFSKVEGIHYDETFGLVARYSSIRSMLALST